MFDYTRSPTEGVLEAGAPSGSRGCRVERQLVFTIVAQVQILDDDTGSTCRWFCSLF